MLVTVAAATVAAACSSGKPSSASSDAVPAATTQPAASEPTTLPSPTTHGAGAPSPGQPAQAAAALLAQTNRDALAQGWAHIAIHVSLGSQTAVFSDDSGPTSGRQVIVVGQSDATVVLVGGIAYIQGNASAMQNYFGFPASAAPGLANRWISFSSSDSDYSTVASAVTLGSALQQMTLAAPLSEGAGAVVNGQSVIPVAGQLVAADNVGQGSGTIDVSTATDPLPVEFDYSSNDGHGALVFSAWAKAVVLSAPAGATPAASIPS